MGRPALLRSPLAVRTARAVVITLAALVVYLAVGALSTLWEGGNTPGILGAALTLVLCRRQERDPTRGFLDLGRRLLIGAGIGLGAALIGFLLVHLLVLGAVLFVLVLSAGVYLRRFGATASRIGTVIALPVVVVLIVPPTARAATPLETVLLPLIAGALAVVAAAVVGRVTLGRSTPPSPLVIPSPSPTRTGLPASTRMAIQLAIALTLAFVGGVSLFGPHWPWVILTVYLVSARSRGRGDVLYTAVLRVTGAVGGAAAVFAVTALGGHPTGPALVAAVFIVVFIGTALRDSGYGWWAAAVTVVAALLAGQAETASVLYIRIAAIVFGAACATLVAWLILPIRTVDVVRRRLGSALRALSVVVHPTTAADDRPEAARIYRVRVDELIAVAPAVRAHARVVHPMRRAEHLAVVFRSVEALEAPLDDWVAKIADADVGPEIARAVGAARAALAPRESASAGSVEGQRVVGDAAWTLTLIRRLERIDVLLRRD